MESQPLEVISHTLAQDAADTLLAFTQTLVARVNRDGSFIDWNPAFERIKASLPLATRLQDLAAPPGRSALRELFRAAAKEKDGARASLELLNGQTPGVYECLLISVPGDIFLFVGEVPASGPHSEEFARLTQDLKDVKRALHIKQTGLEAVLAQAEEIAHTDQLTFLSNQRKIVGDLQRKVTQCKRSRKPLTIFLLDVDRFKQINDTHGHLVGDQVLRTLSAQLREGIRQTDNIGRYGGEEFLILLPGAALESAVPMAERLLQIARSLAVEAKGQVVRLTVSIGIAQFQKGETWKEFLERADAALYESKNNGRDEWTVSKCKEP